MRLCNCSMASLTASYSALPGCEKKGCQCLTCSSGSTTSAFRAFFNFSKSASSAMTVNKIPESGQGPQYLTYTTKIGENEANLTTNKRQRNKTNKFFTGNNPLYFFHFINVIQNISQHNQFAILTNQEFYLNFILLFNLIVIFE